MGILWLMFILCNTSTSKWNSWTYGRLKFTDFCYNIERYTLLQLFSILFGSQLDTVSWMQKNASEPKYTQHFHSRQFLYILEITVECQAFLMFFEYPTIVKSIKSISGGAINYSSNFMTWFCSIYTKYVDPKWKRKYKIWMRFSIRCTMHTYFIYQPSYPL